MEGLVDVIRRAVTLNRELLRVELVQMVLADKQLFTGEDVMYMIDNNIPIADKDVGYAAMRTDVPAEDLVPHILLVGLADYVPYEYVMDVIKYGRDNGVTEIPVDTISGGVGSGVIPLDGRLMELVYLIVYDENVSRFTIQRTGDKYTVRIWLVEPAGVSGNSRRAILM